MVRSTAAIDFSRIVKSTVPYILLYRIAQKFDGGKL